MFGLLCYTAAGGGRNALNDAGNGVCKAALGEKKAPVADKTEVGPIDRVERRCQCSHIKQQFVFVN